MNLLSILLIGFGVIVITIALVMARRPDAAWSVDKKQAEFTGRVKVEQGDQWGTVTAFNIILMVVVGVIALVLGVFNWR